ncbi:MAG TPA: UDP-N-acetylmuramoyl-L-alanyl-D-glutamate--2,6-diaminopimelate ligase [Candidatus Cybelea sp.]|nr:UDP-N-acetylmuramoyl-L-alanyl-D-glutamate--2,6-diaminopimelate ligase [Candidatus Cybelea sp.]
MRLSDLIDDRTLDVGCDLEISGLTADSREVRPGYLFAALSGARQEGADFVGDAVRRGAVAVLTDRAHAIPSGDLAVIVDTNPRRRLAFLAARFYGAQPSVIAAVTGTNGKTSVASFTRQIWGRLGHAAASLGTLGVVAPGFDLPLGHTTPDPVMLHRLLAELHRRGIEHLALEASSHGLDQYRLDAVKVTVAGFTNLSRDHYDYHTSSEAYLGAKLRLFDAILEPRGGAVVNADADVFPAVAAVCRGRGHRLISYGRDGSELRIIDIASTARGQRIDAEAFGKRVAIDLPLAGAFQAGNALCALGLVVAAGGDMEAALAALEHLEGVPGRLQLVARHPNGAPIFVDYAHTPDALATVLGALRPHAESRLCVVFGCGGDRDRGKRPEMGRIAAHMADRVIVTDDNPRSEDPAAIRQAIMEACPDAENIGDRAAAIYSGVTGLGDGDLLVIAGKGHERGQIVGSETRPFDDAEVARAAVASIGGAH